MKQNKIYIIQMHTKTIPSRIIKLITRYEYSHVGVSLERDCNEIYSFGRKKLNNFFNAGFVKENKNGPFFTKFNDTMCRIYEINVTQKQYLEVEKIINNMKLSENEYRYDFLGVILRTFKIPVSFKNRYVCSQFVAQVLEDANIYEFDKNTCFIEPRDFNDINDIKEIYRGKYLLYNN